ncbi:hypothetical protein [Nocardia aurea]|uniref:hypothetical protein n=1 Tax=Nocardia aurea TaxID=2144174 RepID=UPI0033A474CE
MTNRNKVKGDRFEREHRDFCRENGFPAAERTKAGYERDGGDTHLDAVIGMSPGVISQSKNWAGTNWRAWFADLAEQVANARAEVGFLVVKRRGIGDPGQQLAVMPVREFLVLLRRAGYGQPLEEDAA